MKNLHSDGNTLSYEAGADISSGDLVMVGEFAAVAITDIADGDTGTLALTGVYTLPKASAADELTQGAACYEVGGEITHTDNSGNNDLVGYAFAAAAADATEVSVRLKQ